MRKRNRRIVSILLTLSLLVAMLVPMAVPAGAKSVNGVSRTMSVTDTYNSDVTGAALTTLTIKEDSDWKDDFVDGDTSG